MKRILIVTFCLALFVFLVLPATSLQAAEGKVLYNRFNIHAQADRDGLLKASYANYTDPGDGHVIIPPNTKLIIKPWKRFFKDYGFKFELPDGRKGVFEVHVKRLGMSTADYLKLIMSDKPVSLKELTSLDRKGVKQGKALVGMTKKGVMTALGYPSPHATPSLKDNTWKYWRNRFRTMDVEFNGKGRVSRIQY